MRGGEGEREKREKEREREKERDRETETAELAESDALTRVWPARYNVAFPCSQEQMQTLPPPHFRQHTGNLANELLLLFCDPRRLAVKRREGGEGERVKTKKKKKTRKIRKITVK